MTEDTKRSGAAVNDLLALSVDAIKAKFGELDDAALIALHDAEEAAGAKARSTLLGAIHAEQEARARTEIAKELVAQAEEQGVKLYTADDIAVLQGQIDDIKAKLALAEAGSPAKAVSSEPRVLSVTGEAEGALCRLAFTGNDGKTIAGLPDLEFPEGAFKHLPPLVRGAASETRSVTLEQPVVFPEGIKRAEVAKIWLVGENGKAASVCSLVNPLPIGGGSQGRFPAGSLRFDGLPKIEAEAAA